MMYSDVTQQKKSQGKGPGASHPRNDHAQQFWSSGNTFLGWQEPAADMRGREINPFLKSLYL